ncbi:MAG: FHA domain-containing serine/threonine-protein kinase [Xenococcaceae cyanobacterium MO_167.B27]|nr:FHA domain-containing serine/threonine-protein kinase [Xenococcaceae cyanobacterium MO_167.B27]
MSIVCSGCMSENNDNAVTCTACGAALQPNNFAPSYHLPNNSTLGKGKYQIKKILGEGGFGITYEGIDLINNRKVAIKENWPEKAIRQGTTIVWPHTITPKNRQWQLKKFATEAQYIAQCSHPSIVRVYEWFEENNTAYMAMALVEGKPLSNILKEEGCLTSDRAKRYFLQIAEALKVVHDANLLHRDIKPENIIIDRHDRAVLIDFGATKEFVAGQTREMSVTLTRGYAPIEQYSYKSKRWPATDIYALCASMYESLTGELPVDVTERFASETLVPPRKLAPQINPLLEQIILKGMNMRVQDRFQTVDELLKILTGSGQVAKLIPIHSANSSPEFVVDKSPMIVGRFEPGEQEVDINLNNFPGSHTVSRQHGVIYREQGQWKIKDLDSVNGIFIRRSRQSRFSRRITKSEILNSGDAIAFGKVSFILKTY